MEEKKQKKQYDPLRATISDPGTEVVSTLSHHDNYIHHSQNFRREDQ